MSYGFSVRNGANEVTISDTFKGFHFVARATLISGSLWRVSCPVRPVPFIRTNGTAYACIEGVWNSGGSNWDIQVRGTATEVLCFAQLPSTTPSGPWGLQVFTAVGECAFDSTRSPLNIRQLENLSGRAATDLVDITLVAGMTTPAFMLMSGGVIRTYEYGNFSNTYREELIVGRIASGALQFGRTSVYTVDHPHVFEPDLPAPDVQEDSWSAAFIAVIDSAHY